MAVPSQAFEFRKKSNSKREKIFKQRAKKILVPFFAEFSAQDNNAKSNPDINLLLDNIIESVRSDKSLAEGTDIFKNEDEFFELLAREVT